MIRSFSFLVLVGCGETNLSEPWQLDRVRLLGVRAEVSGTPDPVLGTRAEPRPGETVAFSSLIYAPPDTPDLATIWIACLPEGELSYGCSLDESLLAQLEELDEDADPAEFLELLEQIQESGFIGFEPGWPPVWDIPSDALDGFTDDERLEGTNAFVNVTVFPEEGDDEDNAEIGFKRVAVSEAMTPNHNPDIVDVIVAGTAIGDGQGFNARRGHTYTLEPVLGDGHIETYQFRNSAGEDEWRTEEPYFSWYTETGASDQENQAVFDQEISLFPYSEVEWTAPKKAGTIQIRMVVRDRRGGMGWRPLTVNVL